MEQTFKTNDSISKEEKYIHFLSQFALLIEEVNNPVSILANTSAALHDAFNFFWVGFYMVEDGQLQLGPFQGSVACYRIKKGRGVCGTAWEREETIIVPDVHQFPGHIACSSLSRSEIVVPVIVHGEVKGVLDIDSDELNKFDEIDSKYLQQIVNILSKELCR